MQVSDAAASQQQNMAQSGNATYLLDSFHKLVHDLEEPLGVSYPCKMPVQPPASSILTCFVQLALTAALPLASNNVLQSAAMHALRNTHHGHTVCVTSSGSTSTIWLLHGLLIL